MILIDGRLPQLRKNQLRADLTLQRLIFQIERKMTTFIIEITSDWLHHTRKISNNLKNVSTKPEKRLELEPFNNVLDILGDILWSEIKEKKVEILF